MCKPLRPPNVDKLYANQPSHVWFIQSYLSKTAREIPENDYLTCPVGVLLLLTTLLGSGAARADTGSQIAQTLRLRAQMELNDLRYARDEARSLYRMIHSEMTSAQTYMDNYRVPIIHVSNGIFIKEGYHLQTEFRRSILDEFHGQERELNFQNQSHAAKEINYWVNTETKGLIPRFFRSPDELPRDSRLVVFNIFTFKESWARPFAPYSTVVADFWIKEGHAIRVPMMSTVEMVDYADFSDRGFTLIRKRMKPTQSRLIDTFTFQMFSHSIGITTTERLYISMLRQGTVLKVDETGIEAAAATAVVTVPTSALRATVDFHVDQPFVCFLYDAELQIPLLAARIARPMGG
ncbi:unnamed protein product [Echinostoma caproni]|uniref:SERPIN domain-containing protein n=1 Tax=Echinostoma caproni TaxID=27848 RepID=A0A183AAX4_9TREM|nr:unnamed protein product [Echinostoma caproni]